MPVEWVSTVLPDTAVVPNSGPTVASRTAMIVEGLVLTTGQRLRHLEDDGRRCVGRCEGLSAEPTQEHRRPEPEHFCPTIGHDPTAVERNVSRVLHGVVALPP